MKNILLRRIILFYTQTTSKVGFCRRPAPKNEAFFGDPGRRRTATAFGPACIAKLFKFSCFGAAKPGPKSGRLLGIFPTFEVICVYFFSFLPVFLFAAPFPIQFSISETKIVSEIPEKDKDFASLIPGQFHTYIYSWESDFYKDYQRSYFAITMQKGGWDCLRHYEILANGCIPYFVNLQACPSNIMALLPKKLILEAMHLPGVSYGRIDPALFDKKRYFEILQELLDYTRNVLTARAMAQTVLDQVAYKGTGKILFLSNDPSPDYLRCCTLIGLKELLGDRVIDVPKIEHIYTNYPQDEHLLYGKGFTYTKIVEDLPIGRENIEHRIRSQEFDLIIYGSVHRGLRFHDLVRKTYPPHKILYFCGEDAHNCPFRSYPNLFLRENT